MLALVIAEGVAVLLLGLLVAGLLRSHAEILRALHELGASVDPGDRAAGTTAPLPTPQLRDPGTAASDIAGRDLRGTAAAVAVTGTSHDTLLAFLSTGCSTCQPFWSALSAGAGLADGTRVLVVVQEEESESRLRELAGSTLDVIASNSAWHDYDVPGSPHFVYVEGRTGRVVGEGTGPDWPAVRQLIGQASADRAARATGPVGDPTDPSWRDNPGRIDGELLAAGIGPGHPSLIGPPETDVEH
jgi:hypothetical protein